MAFFIASDHAATDMKHHLLNALKERGIKAYDLTPETQPAEHYSDAADRVCEKVLAESGTGLLLCGTGQGTNMRANRHRGIRAALVTHAYLAEMARRHNDANVLVMGARVTPPEMAEQFLDIFIKTPFDGGRHQPRVESLDASL